MVGEKALNKRSVHQACNGSCKSELGNNWCTIFVARPDEAATVDNYIASLDQLMEENVSLFTPIMCKLNTKLHVHKTYKSMKTAST